MCTCESLKMPVQEERICFYLSSPGSVFQTIKASEHQQWKGFVDLAQTDESSYLAFQLNTVSFSSFLWIRQCRRKWCQFRGFRNCRIMLSGCFQLGSTGWNVLGSTRCVMCFLWHSVLWPLSCRRGCVCVCVYGSVLFVFCTLTMWKRRWARSSAACC